MEIKELLKKVKNGEMELSRAGLNDIWTSIFQMKK